MKTKQRKTKTPRLGYRLKGALGEAVNHAKGKARLKESVVAVPKDREYAGKQVAEIRARYGFSQAQFAEVLNVNVETLRSWEQNLRSPGKPSVRLWQIFDEPSQFEAILLAGEMKHCTHVNARRRQR